MSMDILEKASTPISGEFYMRVYDTEGNTLEEYTDPNIIVNDSKEAIIKAISTTNTLGVINTLKVGDDVGADSNLSGNPSITFNDNNPLADTIVRAAGDFLVDDEFLDGMSIVVSGTTSNNATFTIDTVTATTITLISTDTLTNETVGSGTGIVGTPSNNNPRPAKITDSASSMTVINTATDTTPFTIGYANVTSVTFSTTVTGSVVMAAYPLDSTKTLTSAALHTGNGKVFAYKRYPQKSISSLINIDITWTVQFV